MVNIIISGFEVEFDGATGQLSDSMSAAGGNLNVNEARLFSSMEIEVD